MASATWSLALGTGITGSRVTAMIDRGIRVPAASTSDAGPGRAPPPAPSARVLVVEDEFALQAVFSTVLRRAGYQAIVCDSGYAALEVLRSTHVDGLILDYLVPDLRGDVMYAYACGVQPHLTRRTVWATGVIDAAALEQMEASGCPVVRKPFDVTELLAAVAAVLGTADTQGAAPASSA